MYQVKVSTQFSAAHQLRGYKGVCEEMHGHNWKVDLEIEKETLDNIGLCIDFTIIKGTLDDLLSSFEHKNLNMLDIFKEINPSSENIAKWLFDKLSLKHEFKDVKIKVTVYETDGFSASYYE